MGWRKFRHESRQTNQSILGCCFKHNKERTESYTCRTFHLLQKCNWSCASLHKCWIISVVLSSLCPTYPRVVVVSLVHLVLVSMVGVGELVGLHRPGGHPHHGLAAPLLLGQRVRLVLPARVPHHFAEVDIFAEILVSPPDPHAKICVFSLKKQVRKRYQSPLKIYYTPLSLCCCMLYVGTLDFSFPFPSF